MQAHRVYVGTIGEGVFRSLDGGQTFTRAMDGGIFVECYVRALIVHPRDDRTLLIGAENGLYRTTNGADDWQRVESPLNGQEIWSILVPPAQPDTIFAGTRPSRIYRSLDAGRTWQECRATLRPDCPRILHTRVTTLESDPDDPRVFWAGVEIDGIHRSADGGATWERYSGPGLVSQDIHDLAIWRDANGQRVLLAATNADLHRSTDDGRSWQALDVKRGVPWSYCRRLARPVGDTQTVLLGNGNGPPGHEGIVGISTDAGQTWQAAKFPGHANSTIWNFAVHRSDPNLIYASSVSGEVYRSTDGGRTWEKLAREFGEIRALAWTP
jgi:photosystem II stability/assembly factor-like uncharacterized protein